MSLDKLIVVDGRVLKLDDHSTDTEEGGAAIVDARPSSAASRLCNYPSWMIVYQKTVKSALLSPAVAAWLNAALQRSAATAVSRTPSRPKSRRQRPSLRHFHHIRAQRIANSP
jgi:hypothetical protein